MADGNHELRKAGLKVTLPRVKILQILENSNNRHLSAEDVSHLKELADKPYASYIERDEQSQVVEKRIESEKSVNYTIVETSEVMNLSKIFNTTFNLALQNGFA